MKYILFILMVFPFLSTSECGNQKKDIAEEQGRKEVIAEQGNDSLPVCLKQMIDERRKEEPSNPPVQADEYLYNGKEVFLFTFGCCDQFNMLYDDSCKNICAPSGGFTGRGDGRCPDFSKNAKYIRLIWKDSTR